MPIGTIRRWDGAHGAISDDQNPRANWIFAHKSEFELGADPQVGEVFDYEVGADRQGRPRALKLRAVNA